MLVRVCVVSASSKCLKIIMQQYSMQTEVILKYRADNRCYRSRASRARTPEHMHTNTHSSDHRNARHAAEASVMRALGPTAAAGVLCTGSVRSPAALAPSRRPERTPLRAAARAVAIAAAAAFGPRVAAAAGELLAKVAPIVDVPPVASLVRRTDRPMKDGPTAQWPPAGLGTEVTFPPDT